MAVASSLLIGGSALASTVGGYEKGQAEKSAIQLNEATSQLGLQTKKTKESQQYLQTESHNLVSESASGASIASGSSMALSENDFKNYKDDQTGYDLQSKLIDANAQAEDSQIDQQEIMGGIGAITKAGEQGASMYYGGAGHSTSSIANNTSSSLAPENAFSYSNELWTNQNLYSE